jgi:WD40 repeat protein
VYRQCSHQLALLDRSARASQLELTAHHLGCRSLAVRIAGVVPDRSWQTRWCHSRLATGHQVITGHTNRVNAVTAGVLPDGTPVIISGGGDHTVRVWRAADGTPVGEPITGHDSAVLAVAAGALPDGTPVIISGGDDGTVRVWRLADGTPVGEPLPGHDRGVTAVAAGALPDGTPVIISGGVDGTVRVRRLADGTPVGEPLRGHGNSGVSAVAAGRLPDGTPVIISGGGDGTVRVRRLANGTPVVPPLDLPESVRAVAVHGNVIITAAGADIAVHRPVLPRPMR